MLIVKSENRQTLALPLCRRTDGSTGAVALKVIHPNVGDNMVRDIELLSVLTSTLELVPSLRWLGLSAAVGEFEKLILDQVDMQREARNLVLVVRCLCHNSVPQPF
eukprot:m.593979 g.593979  ORF g.593979 m.593979 type:complete len:106 (+) comp22398_c0_seq12:1631-1948(+)